MRLSSQGLAKISQVDAIADSQPTTNEMITSPKFIPTNLSPTVEKFRHLFDTTFRSIPHSNCRNCRKWFRHIFFRLPRLIQNTGVKNCCRSKFRLLTRTTSHLTYSTVEVSKCRTSKMFRQQTNYKSSNTDRIGFRVRTALADKLFRYPSVIATELCPINLLKS